MKNNLTLKTDEIVLLQFVRADKQKIYAHAKRSGIKLHCYTQDRYLLAIYKPPKSYSNSNVYIDEIEVRRWLTFLQKLKSNDCRYYYKVFVSKYDGSG